MPNGHDQPQNLCFPPTPVLASSASTPSHENPLRQVRFCQHPPRRLFLRRQDPVSPHIENFDGKHQIFLRPRRFGKSTLLSTLANYYDINNAAAVRRTLPAACGSTSIPRRRKTSTSCFSLDFSPVSTDGTALRNIRKSFAAQVQAPVWLFIDAVRKELIPALAFARGKLVHVLRRTTTPQSSDDEALDDRPERAGYQVLSAH